MKRMLWLFLCLAVLLTACGQKPAADSAVAAAQLYQPLVQAVGDGTDTGVDLTDAQIAQAVAQLSAAGLTAVHVDAADPVTHPETVAAFWAAHAAGEKAALTLYEVCRDGGLLCHTLRFADGADTVTRTRVVWRDGAFSVSYADTYTVTSLTLGGGRLTYVYDMPDNPPGTDHDGHIDTQEIFTIGYGKAARPIRGAPFFSYLILCAADAGCCRGVQQRSLRQQLHAVGRLRVARGKAEVRERGAQLRAVEHDAVAAAGELQLDDRAQHLLAAHFLRLHTAEQRLHGRIGIAAVQPVALRGEAIDIGGAHAGRTQHACALPERAD